ncbi:PD-(D/E)XK motif protein [Streptomyces sp. NPDC002688]|uniref:PD-(D/E)XK motif protein n=1 Tax=Streptomyces sp. NPDC002688 TaxID=3154423 RepID=UPI003322639D
MTSPTTPGSRHPDWTRITTELASGMPARIAIPGKPFTEVFIDRYGARIGLRTEIPPSTPTPPMQSTSLTVQRVDDGRRRMLEVSTADRRLYQDFLQFACVVADRVQLDRIPVITALTDTTHSWARLIRRNQGLSREQELGLLGELVVLQALSQSLGWAAALSSWKGPWDEEHDFGLLHDDIEVKTTASEGRVHTISSLTQLTPNPERPLWLVSLHYTQAGQGGTSLAELLAGIDDQIRTRVPTQVDVWKHLIENLPSPQELDASQRPNRWTPRSNPAIFRVGDSFPRLSPALLNGLPGDSARRITHLSYRIDLTDMPGAEASPGALTPLQS